MRRFLPIFWLFPALVLSAADVVSDPYAEGVQAYQNKNYPLAVTLLSKVGEESPNFAEAMILAGQQILAERQGRPKDGLALVERAWSKFPDRQATTIAFLRCELLAGINLSVPSVLRKHAARFPEEFQPITADPAWPDSSKKFSKTDLLADLDYLEMLFANAYSYADRRGADWRVALDAVRSSLGETTGAATFAWKLRRVFAVFGDAHSKIYLSSSSLPRGLAPFLPVDCGGRVLAIRHDRTAFIDPDCPFVEAIDGWPVADWLRVARYDVPKGSPQMQRHSAVLSLEGLDYLRAQLGLPLKTNVLIKFVSEDGSNRKEKTMETLTQRPRVSGWPRTRAEVREHIGILPIAGMDNATAFLQQLDAAMEMFRDTRGLIIDVRDNGGGSQDALCTLLPYFLEPGSPLKIVNVAAYRIPAKLGHTPTEGFLPQYRRLYPPTSPYWNDGERKQVESFLAKFVPEWKLPAGFSGWHVMEVHHETNLKAYYYAHPVIVLCDAGSFSATDNFLGAFQGVPNITLMGTPSSGGSGRMADYVLPHTGIPFTLCQMASFRANGQLYDGRGVTPDIVVEPKPADYLKQSDSVLSAAMSRLGAK